VIGDGDGGESGLVGRRERVARNTTAGDEMRTPKRALAAADAPAAGMEAAAMRTRIFRRVVIAIMDDELRLVVAGEIVVVGVVVVMEAVTVTVVGRGRKREMEDSLSEEACELSDGRMVAF
jgi:hypothetical protein